MDRTFVDSPAVREATPLLVGLVGPSFSGKTLSALRLATGFQRVCGGEIFMIDTESRRGLHYAHDAAAPSGVRTFKFRHVPFGAPFSPLDYLHAIEHCANQGARQIIIDSMSHEHEGPGGVLEMHDAEIDRLAKNAKPGDENKRDRVSMLAWQKPKAQRRRLINTILQMPVNFVFCFRAKEKMLIKKGQEPTPLGFMPIAGDEFVYEMTLKCLLLQGADGRPTWQSENAGERLTTKIPAQFRVPPFTELLTAQLSEDAGEALARWAAGKPANRIIDIKALLAQFDACSDAATFRLLEDDRRLAWDRCSKAEKASLKTAADRAIKRMEEADVDGAGKRVREPGEDE